MKTLVVANQKGGVGKSAIASHLGFFCAAQGKRTLVIDLDSQSTTTNNLCAEIADNSLRASALFGKRATGSPQMVPTSENKGQLHVIIGDEPLADVDQREDIDESHLAAFVAAVRKQGNYDVCIIDPPPTLGKRLRAALIASDFVLMPYVPVHESTNGLTQLIRTINDIRSGANPRLQFVGFLANMVNTRSAAQKRAMEAVAEFAPELQLREFVTNRTAITDMLALNRPVWHNLSGESHRKAAVEMHSACRAVMRRVFK